MRSFLETGAEVAITNSTVSGNSASQDGGGVYLNGSALDALITSTTIADNLAGSTIGADGLHSLITPTKVKVKDLILDRNGNRNCLKTASLGYTVAGNNISSDASCEFADAGSGTGDDVDPLLTVLAVMVAVTSVRSKRVWSCPYLRYPWTPTLCLNQMKRWQTCL